MSDHPIQGTTNYELLGLSKDLGPYHLPTNGDVLRASFHLREVGATVKRPILSHFGDVLNQLADLVINCWIAAFIPQLKSRSTLKRLLQALFDKYVSARRSIQSCNNPSKITSFKSDVDQLFDICSCQCQPSSKVYRGKMVCACPEEVRILSNEVEFLNDQRTSRKLRISTTLDSALTSKYQSSQEYIRSKVCTILF